MLKAFKASLSISAALMLAGALVSNAQAEDRLRPYILGSSGAGEVAAKADEVKKALEGQGFKVAGEYAPYDQAHVLVVTSAELKDMAAKSEFGGYGAGQRVSVTKAGDNIQVSYTNPLYMGAIYRMKGDFSGVAKKLEAALGKQKEFGSENGLSAAELGEYHYMMMMPYFTDQVELGKFGSQDEAVKAVEEGLKAGKGGTKLVSRIDVTGKEETLFGVALSKDVGADKKVMTTIDTGDLRHTAHLPYDILVSKGTVYTLPGKFRIAQSFPDLPMGSFMQISDAPDSIENALKEVVAK
jgi:hypothetical protein